MIKKIVPMTLILVLIFCLSACNKESVTYEVKIYTYWNPPALFAMDTLEHKATLTINEGDIVGDLSKYQSITDPPFNPLEFQGWYTDKEGTNKWNPYSDTVKCDLTLYGVYIQE